MNLFNFIRQGDFLSAIISIASSCIVVFLCLPAHELAHAYTAYKLGDTTAKYQGRLSFNPLAHLNLIGTIMIFLFGIGYANPVPVNPNRFKNPKVGMAIVSLAGPASNIVMAFVSNFIYCALSSLTVTRIGSIFMLLFYYMAWINVSLAVFNLLPIPPLDGSKVLAVLIPDKYYNTYMRYEQYVMIFLFILMFSGILSRPISFLSGALMNFISIIPNLIF